MSDIEDTTGRLRMSWRYTVERDPICGRYAVVSPTDETVGWYDRWADAHDAVRVLNGED